jgi:hypothetical protein
MDTFWIRRALALSSLAFVSSAFAQAALPPVPDVSATLGTASATRGERLTFCTMTDPSLLAAVHASDVAAGKHPLLIGWTIEQAPPGIERVVAISTLTRPGCTPTQPLPAGGVDKMELHVPYAIVDRAVDWSKGFTALVMASKNDDLPAADYIPRLRRHVRLVTTLFESKGMDGYMVYAGDNYEWAYLHWTDEDTAKRAFATVDGATGPKDSLSIQRPLPRTQIFKAQP